MSSTRRKSILVVEDSDEDFEATTWAIHKASIDVPISRCRNGEDAISCLENLGTLTGTALSELPAIVLLDLNLPRTDGRQVLKHVKAAAQLKSVPVIVLTSSAYPRDVETCYLFGANSYVLKPVSMVKLREVMRGVVDYWLRLVVLP